MEAAEVLLTDDDETSTGIALTAVPAEVGEGGGATAVAVTATLDAAARTSATEVVVGVAGGGDPNAVDFAPVASFTITIAAEAPDGAATFTLVPEDDAVDEMDETLTLTGSADLAVGSAGILLTDDDETSTGIALTADPAGASEGGGAVTVAVTATLDAAARTGPTEVVVGVAGSGDPTAVDFAPVASFTITIAAQAPDGTATFTLTPEDDAVDEADETLTVSGSADLPVATADVLLTDDDETSMGIALTVDPAAVSEGSGATAVTVTATLDAAARTSATEVVVGVAGSGEPTAVDFDPVASFTITIAAEAPGGTVSFTLTPEDDAVDEADETLTLTGSSDGLSVAAAEVLLTDDDETSTDVALTAVPAEVGEGGGATAVAVTAMLDAAARTSATEVVVGVAGGGDPNAVDFAPVASFTITIAAQAPDGTATFTLTPEDDAVDETDETLTLAGTSDLPVEAAEVLLTDDDETSMGIALTVDPAAVSEGSGAAAVAVTATLDAAARTGSTEVVVGVTGSGDPNAVDFAPVASFTITIAAQAPDGTATFTLTPEDDAVDEADETLTVSAAADLPVEPAVVVLADDDETSTGIALTTDPAGSGEGDGPVAVEVTATLDAGARTSPTTVAVGVAGSGDPDAVDFAPVASFTITIAAQAQDGTATFTLTPEDDAVDEADETLTLTGSADLPVATAEVVLADDDETSTEITLTADPARVGEGGGATAVAVTATLDAGARTGPTEIAVDVSGGGDPAAVDFAPVASFTITIAAQAPSGTATFTLVPEDDAVDEQDETVTVSGAADLSVVAAEVVLADDDETSTRVVLSASPVRIPEGSGGTAVVVTATLDAGARTGPTEVEVDATGSGDPDAVDFAPVASFTITIAAQAPDGTATFTLTPEDDAVDETDETLTLAGTSDLPVEAAVVVLADDDETSTEIALTTDPARVGEDAGATAVAVTATLDAGARTGPTEVAVDVSGSGEPAAVDFAPVASFTITIAAQAASGAATFTLVPEDDAVDEPDEMLTVSGAADLPVEAAVVVLADDDKTSTRVLLSASPARVSEGAGGTAVAVTATLDAGARTGPTEVAVGVSGSGDPAAVDFAPVASFTITIAAQAASGAATFTLVPEDDAVDEPDETLTVSGAADLPVEAAVVVLADDDESSTGIALTTDPAGSGEGDGPVAVEVTATLDAGARTSPTEVAVGVTGSGDPDAVDFAPVASFTITIAAQAPSGTATFTLVPEDDAVDEPDETLTVSGAADLPVAPATVRLEDDDETSTGIALTADPAGASEGDGATAVAVTATLDAGARTGPTTVVVGVAGSGDPGAVDFAPVASFTITIAAQAASGAATFTLVPEDDAVDESDETLTVSGAADLPVAPATVRLEDDDETSTGIALTADPARASEGSGATAVVVTATLDAGTRTGPTTVAVGVTGSGDPDAVDFAPVASFTITIAAQAASGAATFTLLPEDDAVDEPDEMLTVSGAADLPVAPAEVVLADDDETSTGIALTAVPGGLGEGSGATAVAVTATFDAGARTVPTTVAVGVTGSGDPDAVDFAPVASFTITIAAQAASGAATFTLVPEDDAVDEPDETLTLSGAADLPVAPAEVVLADDDETSTGIALTAAPVRASEGSATAVAVAATLDAGARTGPTTVAVSVAGSGDPAAVDFARVASFTITIAARAASGWATFTLTPENDAVDEPDETLTVSGAADLPVESAVVVLADDDETSTGIALTVDPARVGEGEGATAVAVTATLDAGARTGPTEVAVGVTGSGDPDAVDFAPVASFTITIAAQAASGSATFPLTPEDDAVDERDETLTVAGAADLPVESAVVVLADDDETSTGILLSASPVRIPEGSGATAVAATATLDAGARTVPTEVAVDVTGSGDPDAVDFAPVASFTITIAAESESGTATFTLTPEDDAVDEADETLTVAGTSDLSVDATELVLADDDETSTGIALTTDPARVGEGAGAAAVAVTATLDAGARSGPTEVAVGVTGSGDPDAVDFAPVASFTITITAGAPSGTGTFTLAPDNDAVDEPDETLTVAGASDLPVEAAEVVLADDDETSTGIALTTDPARVGEGAGAAAVEVTATLDAGARTLPTVVAVAVTGSGDADAVDFAPVASFTITIAAGASSGSAPFTLTPDDDAVDEGDETLTVAGAADLPVESAEVVLADDDETSAGIALTAAPARVGEGAGATAVEVTAALDAGARTVPTEVAVGVTGSGDPAAVDFAPVASFTITITAGAPSGTGTFTLAPDNDAVDEPDETLTVAGASDLPVEAAEVVLADDDETSTGIALTTDPARVGEGAGAAAVEVTATLDAGARTVPTVVAVAVTGSGDADAVDFAPVPSFTITIAAGASSASATFTLTPDDDAVDERDETLTLAGASALPVASAELVLADDDETSTGIALTAAPARVGEGAGATAVEVTATLDAGARTASTEVAVGVTGSGDPAAVDFAPVASFTITIATGATGGTGTFTLVPEDDAVDEPDETLTLAGASDLPVASAEVVLADDDRTSTGIALTADPTSVSEGSGATAVEVTASLNAAARTADTAVSVTVAASGNSDAVDYVGVEGFGIVIAAGETVGSGTFTLTPEQDNVAEVNEVLTLAGTADLDVTDASVTIVDDDAASTGIELSATPSLVSEGGGPVQVAVTASLNRAARGEATTVAVSVRGSGDAAAVDFEAVADFAVEIPADAASGSATFTLVPDDDATAEADETLTLTGVSDLPVAPAELVLADDDEASTRILLTATPARVSEGAGPTPVTVTAALDGGLRQVATTVTVSVAGSGDPGAVDFEAVSDFAVEIPADAASGTATFTLVPEDDATAEADETLTLTGASDLAVEAAAVVLADDDEASTRVLLTATPARVSEGAGPTPVTVTAALDGGLRQVATTVTVSVAGSGDAGAVDFEAVADFAVEIPADAASGTATFTLSPDDDATAEADETLTLTGSADLPVESAEVVLADDDEASTRVLLTASPARVSEGAGPTPVTVTAALDGGLRQVATTVTVSVRGSGAPGTVGFEAVPDFAVEIPADAASGTATFTLSPDDDATAEADETLTLAGASDLPVEAAAVVLADDDEASTRILLTATPARVSEGAGPTRVTVTAALDRGQRQVATTVTVSVAGRGDPGAVDFEAVPDFALEIPADAASGTATFTLSPDDDATAEADETLTLAGSADLPVESAEVVLADDDEASMRILLTATPARVSEGAGPTPVTVTAALDGGLRQVATTVTVSVAGSGDPGTVGFEAVADFALEIPADAASGTATFTLSPDDDATAEADETLTLAGVSDLTVDPAEVVLADDDEASTRVLLTASPARVSEGAGPTPVTVTAALDGGRRQVATTVTVSVAGTGDPGAVDFEAVPDFALEIPADAASGTATFTLSPEDDAVAEADAALTLAGASDLPVESAVVVLADDDEASTRVLLSATPARVSEGSGPTPVTVTAALDGGRRQVATTVTVSVAGTGASAAVGFEAVADFDVEIAASAASGTATFTLVPDDDATVEADETLTLTGASDLPVESAVVVLADDDEASTRVLLSASPARVSEGAGPTPVTVTAALDGGRRQVATTVTVSVAGTGASAAVGFEAVADFDVEIAASAASGTATFTLVPDDDATVEADETLTLTGVSDLPVESAEVVLADDDEASTRVLLTASPVRVSEGAGATPVTVTAALDRGLRQVATTVTVSVAGSGDPGTVDFEAVADFAVEIPADAASGTATFTLVPDDDATVEADETLTLTGASDLPMEPAVVVLADDDEASTRVLLSATPARVSEGAGQTPVTVTAALDGGLRQVATTVTVSVRGSGDPGAVDFDAVVDFAVEIPADAASGSATFMLVPDDDTTAEADETLILTGASDLPVESAEVVLADDDEASTGIALTTDLTEVGEARGGSTASTVTVTATLNASARTTPTEVTVGVSGSGDPDVVEFAPVPSFTITIAADETSGTGTFSLTASDDAVDEHDETLTVVGSADLPVEPAEVVLADDDETSTGIALAADPARVGEGSGGTPVTVTATLDAGARTEPTVVSVDVTGSDDPDAVDFAPVPSFTITIAAEATSGTESFTLAPEDDAVDERDETLTIAGASDLPVEPAEVVLADDDEGSTRVLLSAAPARVSEGAGPTLVTVTAALDRGQRQVATSVTVSVAGTGAAGTVAFEAVSDFAVEIPANAASGSATFTLVPEDDAAAEADETLSLTGASDLPVESAEVVLADDDEASTRILLSASPVRVSEGAGPTPVTVTAALDRGLRQVATTVTVSVRGSGEPAAVGFEAVSDFAVEIPANAASGSATFTLSPDDDATAEADETLTLAGASDLPVESAEVVLADDDEASTRVLLSASPARVSEGAGPTPVTVTAALDGGWRQVATTVTVSVRGSGAPGAVDFDAVADFAVEIPADAASGSATFTLVPEDDASAEADETLILAGASDLPVETAEVVLADDDEASTRVLLSASPSRVPEDAGPTPVTVTAALDAGARTGPTEVAVSVAGVAGGDPHAVDFGPVASFTITIAADATSGADTFTLTPENDVVDERDETLTLAGASDLPVESAAVVLADDDRTSTGIALTADPTSVSEGSGATAVEVTASLNAAARTADTAVSVTVAATGNPDAVEYVGVEGFGIVIAAGETAGSGTFTLTPEQDNVAEVNEVLTLAGTADLDVTDASVTIVDDDAASTGIELSAAPSLVSEGGGPVEVTVTAALNRAARGEATTVTVSVRGSGDAAAVDFEAVADFAVEIPADAASGTATFTLSPDDDAAAEADETLTLTGAADLPVEPAELVLADDDEASTRILLTATPARVSEGAGPTPVTVTAALDGGLRQVATTVTVSVAGSGVPGAVDFEAVSDFAVEIPANAASGGRRSR